MMKTTSMLILLTVLWLTPGIHADQTPQTCKVVLLPLEQTSVRPDARISERRFQDMAAVQFSRLPQVALLDCQALNRLMDQALVDDAVFELIVTDSLTRTLARLDGLQPATARAEEQRRVAYRRGVRYMIKTSIMPIRRQWHITYKIVDTQTGVTVHARSFYEVDNRPNIAANEIAKRIVRALWKVLNRGQGNETG